MEPLDTDMDFMARVHAPRRTRSRSRMNALLILPILGILLMLLFISAAIFQFDLSDIVDTIIGFMLFFFALFIFLIFWANAPRGNRS
jgi:protein-S-isoprenylcysteine O-methyltransferase Ste14